MRNAETPQSCGDVMRCINALFAWMEAITVLPGFGQQKVYNGDWRSPSKYLFVSGSASSLCAHQDSHPRVFGPITIFRSQT